MEKQLEEHIKIKIAVTLQYLLEKKKKIEKVDGKHDDDVSSYNKIANIADIRKATVSNIFNAKTTPASSTLVSIIEAMGFKLSDFAKIFDSLQEGDLKI
ncbi:helix-turn-helix transcriptional regulator [Flavobacterium psychrotrophum]|uniref:helix-turn-helix transcriptional regulator n=1 Tax=Flavobacterium psychrotrophum TaxID=2294119 RepID=UPI000E310F1F|nr:helix-turn-helix transcriptional regulator [Flavobacterium psychrotrophum]